MKLVIDVPEDIYEALRKTNVILSGRWSGKNLTSIIFDAVANGKPQEQKKGHWITRYDRWGDVVTTISHYQCSECGQYDYDKDDYCPNCGCLMKARIRND